MLIKDRQDYPPPLSFDLFNLQIGGEAHDEPKENSIDSSCCSCARGRIGNASLRRCAGAVGTTDPELHRHGAWFDSPQRVIFCRGLTDISGPA